MLTEANYPFRRMATTAAETRAVSWHSALSIYLPAFVLALGNAIALPAIPQLAKSFGVGFGMANNVVTAFLAGSVIGAIPTGFLLDRFGPRKVLLTAPILTAIGAFLVAAAQTFPQMLVFRFLDGWAAQMWLVARVTAVADRTSYGQRGRQINWMFSMDGAGQLAGPVIGGFVAAAAGLRMPFVIYGLLALAAILPTFWLVQDSRPQATAQHEDGGPFLARQLRLVRSLVLPFAILFVMVILVGIARAPLIAGTVHLYTAYAYNLGPAGIGIMASAIGAVGLPLSIGAGYAMDRFGRKITMLPGFTGLGISLLLIALTAYLHLSFEWYAAVFGLLAVSYAITGGSVQTLGADVAPREARGKFLGLWRFAGQLGLVISPISFGFVADRLGYGPAFLLLGASSLCVAALVLFKVNEPSTR
jgi:MFS family permease